MKKHKFYGVCGNCYKLDDRVWEAIEDPNDGYRSYLESIQPREDQKLIFFNQPVAEVSIRPRADIGGWELIDEDGWVWLEIGTDNNNDYYPTFIFNYHPKIDPNSWEAFVAE